MEKPYIEYQGKKYEFEANMKMKMSFDKDIKISNSTNILKVKQKYTKEELKEFDELEQKIRNEEITDEMIENDEELSEKISKFSDILNTIDPSEITYKYCYLMLKNKYGIDEKTFEDMLNEFANDYGFEKTSLMLAKVIEKVFTQVAEENKKKPLPSWMD